MIAGNVVVERRDLKNEKDFRKKLNFEEKSFSGIKISFDFYKPRSIGEEKGEN